MFGVCATIRLVSVFVQLPLALVGLAGALKKAATQQSQKKEGAGPAPKENSGASCSGYWRLGRQAADVEVDGELPVAEDIADINNFFVGETLVGAQAETAGET